VSVAAPTEFHSPRTIVFGAGARHRIADQAGLAGVDSVLLVTDEHMIDSGVAGEVREDLEAAGIRVEVFADVQPDPTDENVLNGSIRLNESGSVGVVAVGGGSVIDAAKMIAVLAANPLPVSAYEGYHQIPSPGVPLFVIPTTAGTGSEATRVSVITDTARQTKMMILDGNLVPRVALVDPELSATMPPALTANVGVDTLTHGIEAYVSRLANPLSDLQALSCMDLAGRFLERAYQDPDDGEAREAMALAAVRGGLAFSNSSVCLVHAMSRPLGAVFHVPHGLSNATLLPTVTRFSGPSAAARYAEVARRLGAAPEEYSDAAAVRRLYSWLEGLNERLQVPRIRSIPGVEEAAFERSLDKMATDAIASGSGDRNPRIATHAEIIDLYREAW
jgi:alcohol dehydrogenase class IV